MTESSNSEDNVYIMTRTEQQLYKISTEKSYIELDDEFKRAVRDLPVEGGDAYNQFVDTWGTHYPKNVTYGGIGVQVDKIEGGSFQDLVSTGFTLGGAASVPVKGGSVGGSAEAGYTSDSSYSRYFQNSTRITQWKGGTVAGGSNLDSYSVSKDNVQPIAIDFSGCRLSSLLYPAYFKDGTSEADLAPRVPACGLSVGNLE